MRVFKFIKRVCYRFSMLYWRLFASPAEYARHIGVTIGSNCRIETRNWSSEPYLVTIGNNVAITNGVSIHTHGGARVLREQHPDFDFFGKVKICDWAYIGSFSQIMPGVTIGEGALVAAGSLVTKSVDPHMVVAGNPAKVICSTEEFYMRNKQFNLDTKKMTGDAKKEYLLSLPDEMFIRK